MLLMFSNLEVTPKFSVNHNKSQTLHFGPQLFTQQKYISYEETLQNFVSKQGFTPKHWWNDVDIVIWDYYFWLGAASCVSFQSNYRILWSSLSLAGISQSLRFLHGDNHQGNAACGLPLGWIPIIRSDCRILWLSLSVERIKCS